MTMRLLALASAQNASVISKILSSPDMVDGHPREEMVLPPGYAARHGIVYAAVTSEHHGDRLASYIIFGKRITWHDGTLTIPEQMPETGLQAMRHMSLSEMTGSGIFDGVGTEDVEQTPAGVVVHTDVESLLTVVDRDGLVTIVDPDAGGLVQNSK